MQIANGPRKFQFPRYTVSMGVFASILIVGCNVFNPSGEGDGGGTSDAYLIQGENKFREKDYSGAMEAFEKAIQQDSTSSLAYYGYSKSAMRNWQVNASIILSEVSDAQNEGGIPFLGAEDSKLTRYLQATSKVRKALSAMTQRDTLTQWFSYVKDPDSKAAKKDAQFAKRKAFMTDYLVKANQGLPGYHKEANFPLSDRALSYHKIVADYGFVELLYALVHLRDLDQNDTIDSRDNLIKKLNFSTEGGFKVENLEDIAEDLKDPETQKNINNLIQNVSQGLSSAGAVMDLIAPMAGGNTGDSLSNQKMTDQVSQNVDSVISTLGDAVTFYQFGDGKDNDGDGCRDEEILDGKDNDGDGFIDEDSRTLLLDKLDNDKNGQTDPLDSDEMVGSDFILGYTKKSGFVKGDKYTDRATRILVQKDSLANATTLTTGQRVLLQQAKTLVGGCWNNY